MEAPHKPDWIFILGLPVFIIFLAVVGWWWRPTYPQAVPEQSLSVQPEDQVDPIVWKQVPIGLPESEIVDTGDPDWLWFKSYEYGFQIKFPRSMGTSSIRASKTDQNDFTLLIGDFSHPVQMSVLSVKKDSSNFSNLTKKTVSGFTENSKSLNINGINVIETIFSHKEIEFPNKFYTYTLENKGSYFKIDGKKTEFEYLGDQIVKSFSFLK